MEKFVVTGAMPSINGSYRVFHRMEGLQDPSPLVDRYRRLSPHTRWENPNNDGLSAFSVSEKGAWMPQTMDSGVNQQVDEICNWFVEWKKKWGASDPNIKAQLSCSLKKTDEGTPLFHVAVSSTKDKKLAHWCIEVFWKAVLYDAKGNPTKTECFAKSRQFLVAGNKPIYTYFDDTEKKVPSKRNEHLWESLAEIKALRKILLIQRDPDTYAEKYLSLLQTLSPELSSDRLKKVFDQSLYGYTLLGNLRSYPEKTRPSLELTFVTNEKISLQGFSRNTEQKYAAGSIKTKKVPSQDSQSVPFVSEFYRRLVDGFLTDPGLNFDKGAIPFFKFENLDTSWVAFLLEESSDLLHSYIGYLHARKEDFLSYLKKNSVGPHASTERLEASLYLDCIVKQLGELKSLIKAEGQKEKQNFLVKLGKKFPSKKEKGPVDKLGKSAREQLQGNNGWRERVEAQFCFEQDALHVEKYKVFFGSMKEQIEKIQSKYTAFEKQSQTAVFETRNQTSEELLIGIFWAEKTMQWMEKASNKETEKRLRDVILGRLENHRKILEEVIQRDSSSSSWASPILESSRKIKEELDGYHQEWQDKKWQDELLSIQKQYAPCHQKAADQAKSLGWGKAMAPEEHGDYAQMYPVSQRVFEANYLLRKVASGVEQEAPPPFLQMNENGVIQTR